MAHGLKAVREELLIAYADNVISDEKFAILYEENLSRDVFPYCKRPVQPLVDYQAANNHDHMTKRKQQILHSKHLIIYTPTSVGSMKYSKP